MCNVYKVDRSFEITSLWKDSFFYELREPLPVRNIRLGTSLMVVREYPTNWVIQWFWVAKWVQIIFLKFFHHYYFPPLSAAEVRKKKKFSYDHQEDGKFGPWGWPQNPNKQKKKNFQASSYDLPFFFFSKTFGLPVTDWQTSSWT